MKKLAVMVVSVLFVLGFAAGAMAVPAEIPAETQAAVAAGQTQITLGGDLRVRGWYFNNVDSSHNPTKVNSYGYYDERVRLSVDAKVTPNVEGKVQLESDTNNDLGAVNKSSDKYIWGNFNSKPGDLTIREAWMMYKGSGLLGFPAGIKAGHQLLALGNKLFFDHTHFGDDAIVLFAQPTKDLELDLLTIKYYEGNKLINNDDLDGYVGIVNYRIDEKNTINVNYTYLNHSGSTDPNAQNALNVPAGFSLQNFEVAGNGNLSGLGYKYSGDLQFGKWSSDQDARGYAVNLGVNYMLDPINLRASFAYGSGPTTDKDKHKEFQAYLGDDQHYTLIYDYQLNTAAGARDTGVMNTTYYNVGFDVAPAKALKVSLDGYILRASDTIIPGQSKSVGTEIDGKIKYQLAKNLVYEIDAGYMHAGDFYKAANPGANVKNPVILRHILEFTF